MTDSYHLLVTGTVQFYATYLYVLFKLDTLLFQINLSCVSYNVIIITNIKQHTGPLYVWFLWAWAPRPMDPLALDISGEPISKGKFRFVNILH